MALDPVTELEALVDALEADRVAYAVCGALALAIHGHPRATKDIDLLIEAHNLDRALAAAKRVGFDIPARKKMVLGLREGKQRPIQRVSKLDPLTGKLLALDSLIVNDELSQVWATRIVTDTPQQRITVVSRDGLVTMKRIAGRSRGSRSSEAQERRLAR